MPSPISITIADNFGIQIGMNVLKMNADDQGKLFQLLTDNIDVFSQVVPPSSFLLLQYILTGEMSDEDNPPVVEAYVKWKASQGS